MKWNEKLVSRMLVCRRKYTTSIKYFLSHYISFRKWRNRKGTGIDETFLRPDNVIRSRKFLPNAEARDGMTEGLFNAYVAMPLNRSSISLLVPSKLRDN